MQPVLAAARFLPLRNSICCKWTIKRPSPPRPVTPVAVCGAPGLRLSGALGIADTHLTLPCVQQQAQPRSVPPHQASLQPPLTVGNVCASCPKPRLATFTGAQALTGDFKELWVFWDTDTMPIPIGSCGQSLQKENCGFPRETC